MLSMPLLWLLLCRLPQYTEVCSLWRKSFYWYLFGWWKPVLTMWEINALHTAFMEAKEFNVLIDARRLGLLLLKRLKLLCSSALRFNSALVVPTPAPRRLLLAWPCQLSVFWHRLFSTGTLTADSISKLSGTIQTSSVMEFFIAWLYCIAKEIPLFKSFLLISTLYRLAGLCSNISEVDLCSVSVFYCPPFSCV